MSRAAQVFAVIPCVISVVMGGGLAVASPAKSAEPDNVSEKRPASLDESLRAVRKLGARVKRSGDGWSIDFHLRGRRVSDNDLRYLPAFRDRLVSLNLARTRVTSKGLVHLAGLRRLRRLHLEQTRVDDAGVKHLVKLERLEYLNLYNTRITDLALDQLARCKPLKRLYVWKTKVTEAGVERLEESRPKLKVVRGVDLAKLAGQLAQLKIEREKPRKRVALEWVKVSSRSEAPARSGNGDNCEILFENKSKRPVKLFWISYGKGELKFYARLAAGATRKQNSYAKNAWLVTDDNDQPLGYFIVRPEDSRAVIPRRVGP